MSHFDEHEKPTPKYKTPNSSPKSFIVIICLVLAGMYFFANYCKPEKTIDRYFQAMNSAQYDKAVENVSVYAIAMEMPQYAMFSQKELDAHKKEITQAFAQEMANRMVQPELKPDIQILPQYAVVGQVGAWVPFEYKTEEFTQTLGAILIKDGYVFRILQFRPVYPTMLADLKNSPPEEIDELTQSIADYFPS